MNKNIRVIVVPILFMLMLFNVTSSGGIQEEPYPDINISIYPDAINVNSYSDGRAGVKSKSYNVQMAYPPKKIISFYGEEVAKIGFTEFQGSTLLSEEWIKFRDGTKPAKPYVRQFAKAWLEPKKNIRLILVLRYETILPDQWNNNLFVVCQLMPYRADKTIKEFFDKLEKDGKFEQFVKLLEKYSSSDQTVDFEKAVRENPENPNLLEYYSIIKENYKN